MIILGTNSIKDTGYNVANSCRFNSGDSPVISRTLSDSEGKKWSFSVWLKRTKLGYGNCGIFGAYSSGSDYDAIYFDANDQLDWFFYGGSGTMGQLKTNRRFRDVSAWYHLLFVYDSANATAGNRMRLYVNGTEETSFATDTNPGLNTENNFNNNLLHVIGEFGNTGDNIHFGGYMSEVVFLDDVAASPTDFGEFDEDSPTIWKPKDVSGLTFGTNGFYLDFEDSANLGNDANGGQDWSETNLAATDQATDTPTNNFITMNPLDSYYSASTFSEGNLKIVSSSGNYSPDMGTIGLSSGKWFWEVKIDTTSTEDMVGITGNQRLSSGNSTSHLGGMLYDFAYNSYARFYNNNGYVSYGATFGNGDIIGVALDLDSATNTIQFYKNGSAQGSKNITHVSSTENGFYHVSAGDFTSGASMTFSSNFGSPPYAISSGNADGNGYGNFEYSVPSGYYSINTKNLAEFG